MVPNVVPSISMAVILIPVSGRGSNALTPLSRTNSPGVTAGFDYQTGSTPFPPLTHNILERRARTREAGKEAAREGATWTLVRRFARQRMSTGIGDALFSFHLDSGLGLRGKREDSCLLPFTEPRQQYDLAIGELERVMIHVKHAPVDLAKDRNGVAGIGTKHEGGLILDWHLEREFGTRK